MSSSPAPHGTANPPIGKDDREFRGRPSSVVVGVVEHVKNHSLTEDVRGVIYFPVDQSPRSPLTFVLRAGVEPLSLVPAFRAKLHERNPNLAMGKIRPMTGYVERARAPAGFTAVLAAIFGVLALLLAATGIYGVLNYQVSRRLPEMGIRAAVGANARDLLRLVLREGLALAAAGVVLGAAAAVAAGPLAGHVALWRVGTRPPELRPRIVAASGRRAARLLASRSPCRYRQPAGHDSGRLAMIHPIDLKDDDVWSHVPGELQRRNGPGEGAGRAPARTRLVRNTTTRRQSTSRYAKAIWRSCASCSNREPIPPTAPTRFRIRC